MPNHLSPLLSVLTESMRLNRLFLKRLKDTLKIPVLALVDSDPYGLKILSVYMKGENMGPKLVQRAGMGWSQVRRESWPCLRDPEEVFDRIRFSC